MLSTSYSKGTSFLRKLIVREFMVDNSQNNTISSDTQALMAFEANKKSTGLAYVLWFFLGGFCVHRFYLGKTRSGFLFIGIGFLSIILILAAVEIGLVGLILLGLWLLIDMLQIPRFTKEFNQNLMEKINAGDRL